MPTWTVFEDWKTTQFNGAAVDFDTDAIKLGLLDATAAPNIDTDTVWTDISVNEVSGSNYTAAGEALTTKAVTETTGTITFDADDVTWTQHATGFTDARYAVLYKVTGGVLIMTLDLGANKGNVAGDLTLAMDAAGIFTFA